VFLRRNFRDEISRLRAKEHSRKLLISDRSARAADTTVLKATFMVWVQEALRWRRHAVDVCQVLRGHHDARAVSGILTAWMRLSLQSKLQHKLEASILIRTAAHRSKALKSAALALWHLRFKCALRARYVIHSLVPWLLQALVSSTFDSWRASSEDLKYAKRIMLSIIARKRRSSSSDTLRTWHMHTTTLVHTKMVVCRVLSRGQNMLQARAWDAWRELLVLQQRRRKLVRRALYEHTKDIQNKSHSSCRENDQTLATDLSCCAL
jgi:hypothetical protein